MRISDWSSDVCSSDLPAQIPSDQPARHGANAPGQEHLRRHVGRGKRLDRGAIAPLGIPPLPERQFLRSEERRVGKECVSTCRSRWSPYHQKKKHRSRTTKASNNNKTQCNINTK